MWDVVIIRPILNLLLLFYKFLGHETVLAMALVTLLFRLALTPLTLKQQKTANRQRELQPKLQELQEKYKDDKEKLAQEQMKLYQTSGINPMGGCLPLLIQLPLMLGFYQAIIRVLAATPLELLALPKQIYDWIPGLSLLIPLKSQFLWLDLALPDPYYILPILVVLTSFLQQKLMTPPATDAQSEAMNKQMMFMMPIFIGVISLQYAAGLSVYFLISNIAGILQFYLFRREYAMNLAPPVTPDSGDSKSQKKAKAKA
ncbi:MAG: membrane protein insertase YidC [Anaerolineae bacterium]|nr:membrane protein insertase YidC [Anaerolineae bacterium]